MGKLEERLKLECKRVCESLMAIKPLADQLKPIVLKVKLPDSYQNRNLSILDSLELNLRLHSLTKFNDRWQEEGRALKISEYLEQFESSMCESASSCEGEPSDGYLQGENLFLRSTVVEGVVLRRFRDCVAIISLDGDEEFQVKVAQDFPGLGVSIRVGDVLRAFKPSHYNRASNDHVIHPIPELICCYRLDVEEVQSFLDKLENSSRTLEDFLRCYAVWHYVLNEPDYRIEDCKKILQICNNVALLQSHTRMSSIMNYFWSSFKGSHFLKETLAKVVREESFHSHVNLVTKFIENIVQVLPKCGINVLGILPSLILAQNPADCIGFMQKLVSSLALNVTGAKDDLEHLQWNQKPLLPASCELLANATHWKDLPSIKVRKDEKDDSFRYSSEEEYLMTKFTLLREECFHNLKDGIRKFLKDGQFDCKNIMMYRISLLKVDSDSQEGLSFLLQFKPTNQVTDIDPDNNSHWLMCGNLLCISLDASFQCPVWATIANSKDKRTKDKKVYVTFCTERNKLSDAEIITKLQHLNDQGFQAYMFESNTFYLAYGPAMDVLQCKEHVPFKEQLVYVNKCDKQPPEYLKNIKKRPDWGVIFGEPIKYSDTEQPYSYNQLINEFKDMRSKSETTKPKLDEKQLDAVEQALCNKVTLIQGPPGTGKSYVGEAVLQLLLSMDDVPENCGPILVVTYKNFALDHFLQSCLYKIPNFNSKLARVGQGGDRDGTSEKLENCKLYKLVDQERRKEKDTQFQLEKKLGNQLDAMQPEIHHCVKQLRFSNRYSNIPHSFIHEADEKHLKSLFGDESDEAKQLDRMMKDKDFRVKHSDELLEMIKKPLAKWLPAKEEFHGKELDANIEFIGRNEKQRDSNSDDEADAICETDPSDVCNERLGALDRDEERAEQDQEESEEVPDSNDWILPEISDEKLGNFKSILSAGNIQELNTLERIQMVYALHRQYYKSVSDRFLRLTDAVSQKCQMKKEFTDQNKINILKKRRVIGMTVSGAAIKASWLESIKPSVMIVEEAAEILEPQLVAIIPSSVQHLIMIGDHKQLSPQVNYDLLRRKCNLQTSMFERLIVGGLDYTQLDTQGRMSDDIANLVRELKIYTKYETRHEVVRQKCELPSCLLKNMFFYTHTWEESEQRGTHSKYNGREAEKVVEFARYLCCHKVKPSQITILCSYRGQVKQIKTILEGQANYTSVQEIAVTTIDGFQGKENDIILLSLVRSSKDIQAKIGYLSSMNRICVAVSRARCGLYLFGNSILLKRKSTRGWKKVIALMSEKECFGKIEDSFPFQIQSIKADLPSICGTLKLDDNVKRWLVVGIALNTVLLSPLRNYLEPFMESHYESLKSSPHNIHTQSYASHLKKDGTATLNYGSINSNEAMFKNAKTNYNYCVTSCVDLAKLYLKPFMAKFTGFNETCDASAVLGILVSASVFSPVKAVCKKVREDVRNKWGHCNIQEWDEPNFDQCFKTMVELVLSLNLSSEDEQRLTDELNEWRTKGVKSLMPEVDIKLLEDKFNDLSKDLPSLVDDDVERDKVNKLLEKVQKAIKELFMEIRQEVESLKRSHEALEERVDSQERRVTGLESSLLERE